MGKEGGKRRTLLDAPERAVASSASTCDHRIVTSHGISSSSIGLNVGARRELERPRQGPLEGRRTRQTTASSEHLMGTHSSAGLSKATRIASRSSAKQLMDGSGASDEVPLEHRREAGRRWLKSLASSAVTAAKRGVARTSMDEHPHADDRLESTVTISDFHSMSFPQQESDYAAFEDGTAHSNDQTETNLGVSDLVLRQEDSVDFRGIDASPRGVLFPSSTTNAAQAMPSMTEDRVRSECSLLYGGSSYRPRKTFRREIFPSTSDHPKKPSTAALDHSQRRHFWNFRNHSEAVEEEGARYFNDGYELRQMHKFASPENASRKGKRRRVETNQVGPHEEENSLFYLNPRTRADFRQRYERLNHAAEELPPLPHSEPASQPTPSSVSLRTGTSWIHSLWTNLLVHVGGASTDEAHPKPPSESTSSRGVLRPAGNSSSLGSLESPRVHTDLRSSSLCHAYDRRTGLVKIRLPKDNVRLLMDPFLEPGILSVEKIPCTASVGGKHRHEGEDIEAGEKNYAPDVCTNSSQQDSHHRPTEETLGSNGWSSPQRQKRVHRGDQPHPLPTLQYVLTVDAELYRRVVDEMADSWSLPFGLYYCCHSEDEESPRVSIQVAVAILAVLFSLFVIATLIWPLD